MERIMSQRALCGALVSGLAAVLAACGGGADSSSGNAPTNPPTQMANMQLLISDASSDDWATIGVTVLSVALVPQGGASPVTVWTAPSPAPLINLEQLDQLGEILGNVSVPVGNYSGAILTVGANPGELLLVASSNPQAGFAGTAGETIPTDAIQIQGKQGSTGNLTVPITVNFASPLEVTTSGSNALDLEFDLAHPAFIVAHNPPAAMGATLWAVNFNGPVRRHPHADLRWLVLRHTYGTVTAVAPESDNYDSITIDKDFPVLPPSSPEQEITSSEQLQILADSTNGTIFYDLDAHTRTVITDFSAQASTLDGRYVRVAARYQENGTLVAVRVWASSTFNTVWVSPEGHVLNVNATTDMITVEDEDGVGVPVQVNANTQFFFRAPQNPAEDANPIATGTGFLASDDLVRGFKVHLSVVDPLANPLVAQTVDIETAAYSGTISNANATTGFTYTRDFLRTTDDYSVTLDFVPSDMADVDPSGSAITGFEWWNFTFPTLATTGSDAVSSFVAATNGAMNFGGTVGAMSAWGLTDAVWSTSTGGWLAPFAILEPTPLPLAAVVQGLDNGSFTVSVNGGANPGTVTVSTESGAATLVYQVDRSNGVVTISPIDITTTSGLTTLTDNLTGGTPVLVSGVPQANGTLKAYVLIYYTGMLPSM
ncbi:MAG: DUF4382 domain-containing protein [Steroidobacteraceae bacterium]